MHHVGMNEVAPETPRAAAAPDADDITETEVRDTWPLLQRDDRALAFKLLSREHAGDFFLALGASDQAELLATMAPAEKRTWIRVLPPDDAADVLHAPPTRRNGRACSRCSTTPPAARSARCSRTPRTARAASWTRATRACAPT